MTQGKNLMYLALSIQNHDASHSASGRTLYFENTLGSLGRPGVCSGGSSVYGQRLHNGSYITCCIWHKCMLQSWLSSICCASSMAGKGTASEASMDGKGDEGEDMG